MKKNAYNPYLPLNVYIPDGEPHVFDDRVYVFGFIELNEGSFNWESYSCEINLPDGIYPVYLVYHGSNKAQLQTIAFE